MLLINGRKYATSDSEMVDGLLMKSKRNLRKNKQAEQRLS